MTRPDGYVPAAGRESLTRFYDLGIRLTMREGRWRSWLASAAVEGNPGVILDIGCGTGTLTIAMAARTSAAVIGLDGDPAILDLARRKQGSDRVEWREGLADNLPFDDDSVDCVVTTLVMHHVPRHTKLAALAEIKRVLRPGGTLLLGDWGKSHGPGMRAAFFALQCLDGFTNTADNVAGLVPDYVADAGFTGVDRIKRLRTVAGSFEILRATA